MALREHLTARPVVAVHPDAPVAQVLDLLTTYHLEALAVILPDGTFVGVVTGPDVAEALRQSGAALQHHPAATFMRREVLVCEASEDVSAVMHQMSRQRAPFALVVDHGHPLAVVSARDVAHLRLRELDQEVTRLQASLSPPVTT